jgi:hypothetical protein
VREHLAVGLSRKFFQSQLGLLQGVALGTKRSIAQAGRLETTTARIAVLAPAALTTGRAAVGAFCTALAGSGIAVFATTLGRTTAWRC